MVRATLSDTSVCETKPILVSVVWYTLLKLRALLGLFDNAAFVP